MSAAPVEVSVIIPCYNEGNLLSTNVEVLIRELEQITQSYELIFVEDCSTDNTRGIIENLCRQLEFTSCIFNEQNLGRGATFMKGAELANGTFLGYLDIDLEVSAGYLLPVLTALKNGADVATVDRSYQLKWHPSFLVRAWLSKGYKRLVRWYLALPLKDTETGFKFFRTGSYRRIAPLCENAHWFWDTEIMTLAWYSGLKIEEIPGEFVKKREKVSTVRVIPDTLDYFHQLRKFKKRLKTLKFEKPHLP